VSRENIDQNRAAVLMGSMNSEYGTLALLNIGDMSIGHYEVEIKARIDSNTEMAKENERSMDDGGDGKIGREAKIQNADRLLGMEQLTKTVIPKDSIAQTFFNFVYSDFVGHKGKDSKSGLKSYFKLKPNDYLVLTNRGVADSLFSTEIADIITTFERLPSPPDLDVIAEVISENAFQKILKFDENRPLVDRIKKLQINNQKVSIDECFCVVIRVRDDGKSN